ncbi:MAG TPA: hypothetical protein VN688_09555 [Gemmataceae bacterium]|nr:hypothetical protein [Gemmataceae bacterium]
MFNRLATSALHRLGGPPAFQIYGKSRIESSWRIIGVHATHRRDMDSRWPRFMFRGTCITWTAEVIAVGWDFAEDVLREQVSDPASRDRPVEVSAGRIGDHLRRADAGASPFASASEILAHECGHTRQMLRMGLLYWPVVGAVTLLREGPHWWNHFENQASEQGQFGGIVNGSVCTELMQRCGLRRSDED